MIREETVAHRPIGSLQCIADRYNSLSAMQQTVYYLQVMPRLAKPDREAKSRAALSLHFHELAVLINSSTTQNLAGGLNNQRGVSPVSNIAGQVRPQRQFNPWLRQNAGQQS
jgi:hypothetical protein